MPCPLLLHIWGGGEGALVVFHFVVSNHEIKYCMGSRDCATRPGQGKGERIKTGLLLLQEFVHVQAGGQAVCAHVQKFMH
eukprot:1157498-Pelagomonas_calceolata.AAC.1